jgi:acyl-CoA thioesterase
VTELLPRRADLDLIDIAFDESRARGSFLLQPPLLRHDGTLYGGTAIAASIMAMEAATQDAVLWNTTQFVAPAPNGSTIDLLTEKLAAGKRISQVRVTATVEGSIVFTSLGSTGAPRDGGLVGQYEEMPAVSGPEEATNREYPRPEFAFDHPDGDVTFRRMCEYRDAEIVNTDRAGAGTMMLWSRFNERREMTPAAIAFLADMVPVAVARAAGKHGAGTSLDNSLRFVDVPDTEWVLLEMQGNFAGGGYGHGIIRVWSQDGELLATGSQTASMIYVFDEGDPPPHR